MSKTQHDEPRARPCRLVIADDSPHMRWFVREAIGHEFHEVVEAADGRELFMALVRAAFNASTTGIEDQVIVADLCMPTYDGFDVLDACRELELRGKAILITAFPSDEVRARAQELDAVVLAKPFSITALRAVLREATHVGGRC